MSEEEFADKIEWEGGVFEALDWGLHPNDLDKREGELYDSYKAAYDLFYDFRQAVVNVESVLDDNDYNN